MRSLPIKLTSFEGPLDVLLLLIEQQKLDISEIALSTITDRYLAFISENHHIPFADLISFIDIASRLIVLKTRLLLPYLKKNEEEDENENLVQSLFLYKQYKDAAICLLCMWNRADVLFAVKPNIKKISATLGIADAATLSNSITPSMLCKRMRQLAKRHNRELKATFPIRRLINIREALQRIIAFLATKNRAVFSEIFIAASTKTDIIVHFLAVLELCKNQEIYILQKLPLGEIVIEKAQ